MFLKLESLANVRLVYVVNESGSNTNVTQLSIAPQAKTKTLKTDVKISEIEEAKSKMNMK